MIENPVLLCNDFMYCVMISRNLSLPYNYFIYKKKKKEIYLCLHLWVQSLLSRADSQVKELRQSIDLLKAESEKLEVIFWLLLNPQ